MSVEEPDKIAVLLAENLESYFMKPTTDNSYVGRLTVYSVGGLLGLSYIIENPFTKNISEIAEIYEFRNQVWLLLKSISVLL